MKPRPPLPFEFDPKREDHAYFLGLLATDGSIFATSRNRGRVAIELSIRDAAVLDILAASIPYGSSQRSRVRTTNFRQASETVTLTFFDLRFRRDLEYLGYRAGRKSATVGLPKSTFDEIGFWRGVVDGDGSLGITGGGHAFVSLVTASQPLRDAFVEFVSRKTGSELRTNRNARDRVYNLLLFNERAQRLVSLLYSSGDVAIARKAEAASRVLAWRRPLDRKLRNFEIRPWTPTEDAIALSDQPQSAIAIALGRTVSSVSVRRWRLRQVSKTTVATESLIQK
jgi:hypothetical protein